MGNMSYCRFENTLRDLRDCHDNWEDARSEEEKKARQRLLVLCQKIVDAYGED